MTGIKKDEFNLIQKKKLFRKKGDPTVNGKIPETTTKDCSFVRHEFKKLENRKEKRLVSYRKISVCLKSCFEIRSVEDKSREL